MKVDDPAVGLFNKLISALDNIDANKVERISTKLVVQICKEVQKWGYWTRAKDVIVYVMTWLMILL